MAQSPQQQSAEEPGPARGPVPTHGLRERKKLAARKTMVEAALELFWDGGYQATTLEQLTERAGVSMRTFFRYFDSKQAVTLAAENELWAELTDEVGRVTGTGMVLELLRDAMTLSIERMDADWDRRFLIGRGIAAGARELFDASSLTTLRTQTAVVEILENRLGVDSRHDVRLRLACDMAMSAWRTGAQNWVRRGRRAQSDQQHPESRALLIRLVDDSFDALPMSLHLSA